MMRGRLVGLLLAFILGDQQPRDNQRPTVGGSGTITGVVLDDAPRAAPLRRVRVTISGSELEIARAAITNDAGAFTFDSLPAGRFTLTAAKDGYPTTAFDATRPGGPGKALVLRAGENRDVRLQLPRGAVLTGMVHDPQGDPAPGVTVTVLSRRYFPTVGEQRLREVPNGATVTDDRGVYRVFGLAAGSYVVSAVPRLPPGPAVGGLTAVSPQDVQRALAEVRERRTANRPGMPQPAGAVAAPPPRTIGIALAPTYYPGTTAATNAAVVTVKSGETRSGLDFEFDYVPVASVEGFVTGPPGTRAQLVLTQDDTVSAYQPTGTAVTDQEGRFSVRRLQPGQYVIHARAAPLAGPQGPIPQMLWGRTEVVVAGENIEGVTLALEPTLTLSGELVFEGANGLAPSLNGFRLPLQIGPRATAMSPFPVAVVEGSRVVLRGVVPGPYRFMASPLGIRSRIGPWWLKSILLDGREVLDEPIDIAPNTKDLRVTFAAQASQLSGLVVDAAGAPVTDAHAIVFSENPRSWFLHSRRVAAVQLNAEGRYAVWNLPAGNYFVAVTSDLENNEWFDPEALQALRQSAVSVIVQENKSHTRDLTVRRAP